MTLDVGGIHVDKTLSNRRLQPTTAGVIEQISRAGDRSWIRQPVVERAA